jgi:hypothetical protein
MYLMEIWWTPVLRKWLKKKQRHHRQLLEGLAIWWIALDGSDDDESD